MPTRASKLTSVDAVALLEHDRSAERRRGAKRLRELADKTTAAPLRRALAAELQSANTWETCYEMVLALGHCGSRQDIEWLKTIAHDPRDAVMINAAIGEALVRLGGDDAENMIMWCLNQGVDMLAEGAERGVALLRLQVADSVISALIADADARLSDRDRPNDTLGIWVIVAAAGWSGDARQQFLETFKDDDRPDVAEAARAAARGNYMTLSQY